MVKIKEHDVFRRGISNHPAPPPLADDKTAKEYNIKGGSVLALREFELRHHDAWECTMEEAIME
ncbi:hypothetical protein HN51_052232, partial [Arachis hypogaea]